MISPKDVDAQKFNAVLKEELKNVKEINPPAWISFVKSGVHRERIPAQEDFWHIRNASVLRRLYLDGPVGIEKLRSYFGGKERRGHKPAHFRKSSGNIIRKILQQLESAGLVDKSKKGRNLSPKGRKLLDKIAYDVSK